MFIPRSLLSTKIFTDALLFLDTCLCQNMYFFLLIVTEQWPRVKMNSNLFNFLLINNYVFFFLFLAILNDADTVALRIIPLCMCQFITIDPRKGTSGPKGTLTFWWLPANSALTHSHQVSPAVYIQWFSFSQTFIPWRFQLLSRWEAIARVSCCHTVHRSGHLCSCTSFWMMTTSVCLFLLLGHFAY